MYAFLLYIHKNQVWLQVLIAAHLSRSPHSPPHTSSPNRSPPYSPPRHLNLKSTSMPVLHQNQPNNPVTDQITFTRKSLGSFRTCMSTREAPKIECPLESIRAGQDERGSDKRSSLKTESLEGIDPEDSKEAQLSSPPSQGLVTNGEKMAKFDLIKVVGGVIQIWGFECVCSLKAM